MLLLARSAVAAGVGLGIYAIGQSLVASAIGTTTARYFGRAHHGAIRSPLGRIGVIATGAGPLIFGLSQRFTGAYSAALVGFAAICLPSLVGSFWLVQPSADPAK